MENMENMENIIVKLVTVKPLHESLRTDFLLAYDPYFLAIRQEEELRGDAAAAARETLRDLGVFFYRSSNQPQAIILDVGIPGIRGDGATWDKRDAEGFKAYSYMAECHFPVISVCDYPRSETYDEQLAMTKQRDKILEMTGYRITDNKMWLSWAKPILVHGFSPSTLRSVPAN